MSYYQDPRDVYIALRPGGQDGDGSIDDPYDGSVVSEAVTVAENGITLVPDRAVVVLGVDHDYQNPTPTQITLSGVTGPAKDFFAGTFAIVERTCNGVVIELPTVPSSPVQPYWNDVIEDGNGTSVRLFWPVVKVTTATNHSLAPFEVIRLEGLSDAALNGEFVIVASPYDPDANPPVAGDWFYCLLNAVPGSASGTPACVRRVYRFDQRMHAALSYSRLNLGPGTFETRGMANLYVKRQYPEWDQVFTGFTVKPGQKIRGSGIDVTVLKVAFAVDRYANTSALASYLPVNYFEVSDLTVDCNLGGQPIPAGMGIAPVTCAAVWVSGQHNRVRRMRAINFGDQARPECFVVLLNGHFTVPEGAVDNVIEDCIVEKPGENNTHETSSLACASPDHVTANNRGSVVRHNYLNFEHSNGSGNHPIAVKRLSRISQDPPIAELETVEPHAHIKSKALVVRGALVGGNPDNKFNGVFAIDEINSATVLRYRLTEDPQVAAADADSGYIGLGRSNEWLYTDSIEYDPVVDETLLTITTRQPHHFLEGRYVQLRIWQIGNHLWPGVEGAFPVESVNPLAKQLTCRLPSPPTGWPDPPNGIVGRIGGAQFHGPTAAGTACVTEANAVYNTRLGYYSDTGCIRDGVLRNNYYSSILIGVYQNYPPGSTASPASLSEFVPVKTLKRDPASNATAVLETNSPHRLVEGQVVMIRNAFVQGILSARYNGTFCVTAVVSDYKFTYTMAGDPGGDADLQPDTPQYAVRWSINHLIVENNIFEGYPTEQDSAVASVGIATIGYGEVPPYVFPQWVIRGNFARHVDNAPETTTRLGDYAKGMRIQSVGNAIVDGNVVDLPNPHIMQYLDSGSIVLFGNQTPSGSPLSAVEEDDSYNLIERDSLDTTMRTAIEEAMLLSFL